MTTQTMNTFETLDLETLANVEGLHILVIEKNKRYVYSPI